MDTKEKLEQAAVVKEKGTMYFKVCKSRSKGDGDKFGVTDTRLSSRQCRRSRVPPKRRWAGRVLPLLCLFLAP